MSPPSTSGNPLDFRIQWQRFMTPRTASGRLIPLAKKRVLPTARVVGLDCDNLMSEMPDASAPCYAPYGAQSLPGDIHPVIEQAAIVPTIQADTRESETPKPWEKGSKTGKKIKKGRGHKPHSRTNEETSSSSSKNSINNVNNVSSDGVSTTATSAPVSSRPSSGSPFVLDPMLAGTPAVLDPIFGPVQQERESILRATFTVCAL
jgi:hypothetical protein